MRNRANALGNAAIEAEVVSLTPTEASDMLVGMYLAGTFHRSVLLKGSPGIGKTSIVRQAADKLRETFPNFNYIEINPTMPADEVAGIPDLVRREGQATVTDYALPAWFPTDPEWVGIICLDDGLQGDRLMQQTIANMILARNLRGHPFPKGAMFILTGNRMEDKAGVTRTLSHLADRMVHINVAADPDSWIDNFALPNGIDEKIVGYIVMDKGKLDMFDPNAEKCATPRTWEAVDGHLKYLKTLTTQEKRNKMAQALLAGELGQGEAIKFWAFCDKFGQIPDPEAVLKDPKGHSINYPIDIQYALTVALANRMNVDTFGAAVEYIDRIGPDLTTLAVKLGMKGKPEIKKSPAYVKWLEANQDVLFNIS